MRNAAARGAGALLIIAPGVQQMPRTVGAKHPEDAETAMRVANAPCRRGEDLGLKQVPRVRLKCPMQAGRRLKPDRLISRFFHAAARMGEAHGNAPCRDESAARVGMERKK